MRVVRMVSAFLLLCGFVGCGGTQNEANYTKAAIGTGVAIAAVGVHRAITKDCWARCSPGYLCNENSGLCEPGECYPGCEVGSHCVHDIRGMTYCARDDRGRNQQSPAAGTPPPHPKYQPQPSAGPPEPTGPN